MSATERGLFAYRRLQLARVRANSSVVLATLRGWSIPHLTLQENVVAHQEENGRRWLESLLDCGLVRPLLRRSHECLPRSSRGERRQKTIRRLLLKVHKQVGQAWNFVG